jgi:methionine-S-sulfoxide reductase
MCKNSKEILEMLNRFLIYISFILFIIGCGIGNADKKNESNNNMINNNPIIETATFAGGCFWCMEPPYDDLLGVISTTVGYTGGKVPHPTYEEVSTGETGHAEAVQVKFDSTQISYADLLEVFWRNIDPTNPLGQFADYGSQYRTTIFYHDKRQKELALKSRKELEKSGKFDKPIVTEIVAFDKFYPAEDYHQEFYKKNPLRYNSYKIGSGRAGFLEKMWGEEKK